MDVETFWWNVSGDGPSGLLYHGLRCVPLDGRSIPRLGGLMMRQYRWWPSKIRPARINLALQLAGRSGISLYWCRWMFASTSMPQRVNRTSIITVWMKKRLRRS
jgi:hypothetical protein